MASGAAEILLQCVVDGSLTMHELEIQRRPYHRECKCALHNLEGLTSYACSSHGTLTFPRKQPNWTDCSLSIQSSKFSSRSSPCCDSLGKNRDDIFKAFSSKQ